MDEGQRCRIYDDLDDHLIWVQPIAVGGGGAGGAVAPPFGSKRRKFGQMVNVFRQIVWIFGRTSAKIPS